MNLFEGAGPPFPMAMSKGLSPLIVFRPLYIVYRKLPPLAVPTMGNVGIQTVKKSLVRGHFSDNFHLKRHAHPPGGFLSHRIHFPMRIRVSEGQLFVLIIYTLHS